MFYHSKSVGVLSFRQNGDWNNRFYLATCGIVIHGEIPTRSQGFRDRNNGVITIRSPHRVTVNEDVSANQTIVNTWSHIKYFTTSDGFDYLNQLRMVPVLIL
jgi:hypothetical protein